MSGTEVGNPGPVKIFRWRRSEDTSYLLYEAGLYMKQQEIKRIPRAPRSPSPVEVRLEGIAETPCCREYCCGIKTYVVGCWPSETFKYSNDRRKLTLHSVLLQSLYPFWPWKHNEDTRTWSRRRTDRLGTNDSLIWAAMSLSIGTDRCRLDTTHWFLTP